MNITKIQIDSTTVGTCVSFISIIFALIVFLKKFYTVEETLNGTIITLLFIALALFAVSAIISYLDIARNSYDDINDIISIKFIGYIMGVAVLGVSTILLIGVN